MRNLFFILVLLASVVMMSCNEVKSNDKQMDDSVGEVIGGTTGAVVAALEAEEAEEANATEEISGDVNMDGPKVLLETEYGNMKIVLFNETPKHRDNFIKLVEEGFYDDLLFHRVIKGFMIQGGDPESKGAAAGVQLGNGGPGYTIPAEFNKQLFHRRGALAAARLGDQMNPKKESSGSQFYIVQGTKLTEEQLTTDMAKLNQYLGQLMQKPEYASLREELNNLYMAQKMEEFQAKMVGTKPIIEKEFGVKLDKEIDPEMLKVYTTVGGTPNLDMQYTVFGQVISGMDVIDHIAAVKTAPGDRPVKDVKMKISVIEE